MNVSVFLGRLCIAICCFAAAGSRAEPPGRVGRIAYIAGAVSFFENREEGWRRAEINYPVTTENSLWTEQDGRVEVRVGPSALRLDGESVLDILKLEDDLALGYLQRGSVNVRLRQFGNREAGDALQINTREGRFLLEGNGRYRLDVPADGSESRLSVFYGTARYDSLNEPATRLAIEAGRQLTVRITGSSTDFRYEAVIETPFDRWAGERDRQWDLAIQRNMQNTAREADLSPYMTGAEELDAYGDWVNDAEHGRLWAPRAVAADWAPYRYGRWNYVRPWGWTWIDDAPWGFAPFHYGRWVQVRSRWCWWPGPRVGRPVYAPALVAWIGNAGGGLTISTGPAVGWFPLAPREYYVPRYTTNPHYHRRINHVANNTISIEAPLRYRNQVPGATIVADQVFINGNPVGGRAARVPPQVIAGQRPAATPDTPRPPPRTPNPARDRRDDNRPVVPAPRPGFAGEIPSAAMPAPVQPVPRTDAQRPRPADPVITGPVPTRKTTPEVVQRGAFPPPGSAENPPVPPPRQQPSPVPVPPPQAPGIAPAAPSINVEPAPVNRDRNARQSAPGSTLKPTAEMPRQSTHPAPAPVAAPVAAPRLPTVGTPPVAKDAGTPAAKPVTEKPAKPQPDDAAEGNPAKSETKARSTKPGVAKD